MKHLLLALLSTACLLSATPRAIAQTSAPNKQWDKTFGGSMDDEYAVLQQTSDGGYIIGGRSLSTNSGDKTQVGSGRWDYWIVKLDASGSKQWDRTFGGTGNDMLRCVQQTSDGGYILGGYSDSPISGDKTQANHGVFIESDYWIIKLDASGNKQWDRTLGTSSTEFLHSLQQTSDGGYILGGSSDADINGDKTQPSHGSSLDYWVIKLDASGAKQWDRTLGSDSRDILNAIQQTSDGGYILGGLAFSSSSGDKTQPGQGDDDYWVVKLDASGTKQWDRTFGGNGLEYLTSLKQTSDGGYILGGYSNSTNSGDKTQPSQGGIDYWVVKLNGSGAKQWDRTLGGANVDVLNVLQQTSEGGYILGGRSNSSIGGDKTQPSQGADDYWVVKLDATGTKQWDRTWGGATNDELTSLQQTSDGGYILGGYSDSSSSGDKTQPSQGNLDYWAIKLGAATLATTAATTLSALSAYPNPTRTQLTLRGPLGSPYQLLNQLGQVVHAGQLSAQPLNVRALPAGLYLLRDQTSGRTTKIVKE